MFPLHACRDPICKPSPFAKLCRVHQVLSLKAATRSLRSPPSCQFFVAKRLIKFTAWFTPEHNLAMEPPSKPAVTWEDQQNINKFSNAYQLSGELEALLSVQKKLVDDLEDASAELMLADDDEPVKMLVGQCFWHMDKEASEAKLEQLAEEAKQEQAGLEQQLADVHTQMADLRTKLYARLGDSINLDVPHSAVAGKA